MCNACTLPTSIFLRLRFSLPREVLLDIYRAFARPHLDYGDILYDSPGNSTFVQRMESIQYNAALAITGCIRGSSREKLYSELGLESLADRRYSRRMCFFYKIMNGYAPSYLKECLPVKNEVSYSFRSRKPVKQMTVRTECFRNSFFPFCLSQWNKLDCHIRDLPSLASFKRALLQFFRPSTRSVFKCQDRLGVIYLTRLRVGFSHLNEHKFRHNFSDITDPFCPCRTGEIEDNMHYLLQCPNFINERLTLFNDLKDISVSLFPYTTNVLCDFMLFGCPLLSDRDNGVFLNAVIRYIISSRRFEGSLF